MDPDDTHWINMPELDGKTLEEIADWFYKALKEGRIVAGKFTIKTDQSTPSEVQIEPDYLNITHDTVRDENK